MPTTYNGQSDAQAYANSSMQSAVLSSTDATPIVITTSAAHGLNDGDQIVLWNHQVNVNANGRWVANVTSPTTFRLLVPYTRANSVGSGAGAGGATGNVAGLNWSAQTALMADGDAFNAANLAPGWISPNDRTASVAATLAFSKVVGGTQSAGLRTDTVNSGWGSGSGAAASWSALATLIDAGPVFPLDTLDVSFTGTGWSSINDGIVGLFAVPFDPGTSPTFPTGAISATANILGCVQYFDSLKSLIPASATMSGLWQYGGTRAKSVRIYLGVRGVGGTATVNMAGNWNVNVRIYR